MSAYIYKHIKSIFKKTVFTTVFFYAIKAARARVPIAIGMGKAIGNVSRFREINKCCTGEAVAMC
jgi:hypothetical protein